MKRVTISRDAFARHDVVREKATGECAWCGQPARWRYGIHADGVHTRPSMGRKVFCSRSCERSYSL